MKEGERIHVLTQAQTHAYKHRHTQIHTHISTDLRTQAQIHAHNHRHTHISTNSLKHRYTHTSTHTHTSTDTRTQAQTHAHKHRHTHTGTDSRTQAQIHAQTQTHAICSQWQYRTARRSIVTETWIVTNIFEILFSQTMLSICYIQNRSGRRRVKKQTHLHNNNKNTLIRLPYVKLISHNILINLHTICRNIWTVCWCRLTVSKE